MKKIIDGKVYDTKTAKMVGEWSNFCYTNDFNYCSEDLYLKKTGEFFLRGQGGAMSKYSQSTGNNSCGYGELIIPLTYAAAQEWAEKKLDGEEYEAIFGTNEDEEVVIVVISLTRSSHEKIKRMSERQEKVVSAIIEQFIISQSDLAFSVE